MPDRFADQWALVTGASSGIGAEFARTLAARGMHLILTARREDRLRELGDELDTRHGTQCEIIALDLTEPGATHELMAEIDRRERKVSLLVNNAGFGHVGEVESVDPAVMQQMIQLNIAALTDLTFLVLPGMLADRHGGIINVASVAAFQPVAYMGVYAATKAFVLHFSEALWAEVHDRGVTVTALCPGTTRTEFFDVAGVTGWLRKHRSQSVEQVVKAGLRGLKKDRQYYVSGWLNYILTLAVRLVPRKMVVMESMKYFRPHRKTETSEAVDQPIAENSQSSDSAA